MFLPLGSQQSVSEETPRYSGQLFDPQNESELHSSGFHEQVTAVVVGVVAAKDVVVGVVVVVAVVVVVVVVVAVVVVVVDVAFVVVVDVVVIVVAVTAVVT